MKPASLKTKPSPATRLRKAVFGGSLQRSIPAVLAVLLGLAAQLLSTQEETLPPLKDGVAPQSVEALWANASCE